MKNDFISNATPLLTLISKVSLVTTSVHTETLFQQCLDEIVRFETALIQRQHSDHAIHIAKYCLCAYSDESILKTTWGKDSVWRQHQLLYYFFKASIAGNQFYTLLNTLQTEHALHAELLEFLFLLLSLGFKGKYSEHENVLVEDIRTNLYRQIQRVKPDTPKPRFCLTEKHVATHNTQPSTMRIIKPITSLLGITLGVLFLCLSTILYIKTKPIISRINAFADAPLQRTYSTFDAYHQELRRNHV